MKQHLQTRDRKQFNGPNGKAVSLEDYSTLVYGDVPPQAIPLEESTLGAILIDKDIFGVVLNAGVTEDTFYLDAHQVIFRAMNTLYKQGFPIDLLTVTEQLKKAGHLEFMGGPYYLVELSNKVASSANTEYHCRLLMQKAMRRDTIKFANDLVNRCYKDTSDEFDILDYAQTGVSEVGKKVSFKTEQSGKTIAEEAKKEMRAKRSGDPKALGIKTGIHNLDRQIGSLLPSDLIVIAARPGMGKSSLVTTFLKNMTVDYGKKCGLLTFEMSAKQQFWRLVSQVSDISMSKIKNSERMSDEEFALYCEWSDYVESLPILYYDGARSLSIVSLKIKAMVTQGAEIIMIDYVQLMNNGGNGGNREQEISSITRELKSLAAELGVPIIALSQVSRSCETAGGMKRPNLIHLRESGSLEQDADMVWFIYRPEYYGFLHDEQGQSLKGIAEIIIAKNRNGPLRTVITRFIDFKTRFEYDSALDDDYEESNQIDLPF